MLKVDMAVTHVPVSREQVVTLLESINQPLVNIPNVGTAATRAFVLGVRNPASTYTVFVALRQEANSAGLIYVSEPRDLTAAQYRLEEGEALRFVESMGFTMDNLGFRAMAPDAQQGVMARHPLFRPPTSTLDLVELAEDGEPAPPLRALGADAMFGGIGLAQQEAFRRAAAVSGGGSGLVNALSASTPTPPKGPLSHAQVLMGTAMPGPARTSLLGVPAQGLARQGSSGVGVPIIQGEGVGKTITGEPGMVIRGMPSIPSLPLAQGTPLAGPGLAADGLARLGRLLATFCVLAVLAGAASCHPHRPGEPLSAAAQSQLDIGEEQLSQGQWSDAVRTLNEVIELAPDSKEALHGLGLAYMNLGRPVEAEANLRKAVAADAKWSIAKNTLSALLIQKRQCEEAAQLLAAVLEDIFYPTPEFAEHNLARAEFCVGHRREGVRRLENLVLKRPQFCLGYLTLADMSADEKLPEVTIKACEDFQTQCEKQAEIKKLVSPENSALCYLRKGLAYAQLGDVQAARQAFANCNSEGAYGRECKRSLELLPPE